MRHSIKGVVLGVLLTLGCSHAQTLGPGGGGVAGTCSGLAGDVTGACGSNTVVNLSNVSNSSLANNGLAHPSFTLGAASLSLGNTMTSTTLTAQINAFTSALSGAAPASGGGTTNFLRADGVWAAPPGGGSGITQLTGDVTAGPGSGSQAATVANLSSVTNASLANSGLVHSAVTIGSNSGGTSVSLGSSISSANLTLQVNAFTSALAGDVTASGGGTSNFLRADGSWAVPPGTGGGGTFTAGAGESCTSGSLGGTCTVGSSTIFATYGIKTYTANQTLAAGDNAYTVLGNSASAVSFTLPSGQATNWAANIANQNTGIITILAGTGNLYPSTTMTLSEGESASSTFDGTNFLTLKTSLPNSCANDSLACITSLGAVTGTASSTTFLRGDGTWSTPASGANPCSSTSSSLQYEATPTTFGCVSGVTSNGTTMTVATSDLLIGGSSTGTIAIASGNSSATNYTATLPANTGNIDETTGSITNGHCAQFSGTVGLLADSGAPCGGSGTITFPWAANCLAANAAGTTYCIVSGSVQSQLTTRGNAQESSASTYTLTKLYVTTGVAPGAGITWAFTIEDNATLSNITCSISGGSSTTCNDILHTLSVIPGDLLDIKQVTSGGNPSLTTASIGIEGHF